MCSRLFVFLGLAIMLPLQAQDRKPQSLLMRDLNAEERTRLEREKIVISRQEVKQCFSAYMDNHYPRFITSDAVLNAYHVLFEETLRQQEIFQTRHLHILCNELWRLLAAIEDVYRGDDEKILAAKKRARFVIGVAVRLLDEPLTDCEPGLQQAIEAEVKLIEIAKGQHKPALLGTPDPDFLALDATLFMPVGFYQKSTTLQRYFRALRWLQVVPFRAHHEEEHLAFHMMTACTQVPVMWDESTDVRLYPAGLDIPTYERILDVDQHRMIFASSFGLSPSRADLFERNLPFSHEFPAKVDAAFFNEHIRLLDEPNIKDRIIRNDRIRETMPDASRHEFRVLTDFKLPEDDALTFLSRVQERPITRRSPGLEFAAWLSVPKAEKMLGKELLEGLALLRPKLETYGDENLQALSWWQRALQGYASTSVRYHAALRLLAEVDERAPAFMRGEAWRTKTMQTVAASWAQNRHAWALQSKPETHVLSAAPSEAGFVEPVPEFYRMLGSVAERLGETAFDIELNNDPVAAVAEELKREAAWLRDVATSTPSKDDLSAATWSGIQSLADYRGARVDVNADKPTVADLHKLADALDALVVALKRDARPGSPVWERVQAKTIHTARLWHKLQIVCLRLAALADKQLHQTPFSPEDARFLERIGHELSEIMLYRGEAMMFPYDDAPRITRIAHDPATGQMLHIGIGRPRLMFVLYPWEGREILCRGVVMPYHEVRDTKVLQDGEWRERQDGPARAGIPEWLADVVPAKGIVFRGNE